MPLSEVWQGEQTPVALARGRPTMNTHFRIHVKLSFAHRRTNVRHPARNQLKRKLSTIRLCLIKFRHFNTNLAFSSSEGYFMVLDPFCFHILVIEIARPNLDKSNSLGLELHLSLLNQMLKFNS